METRANYIIVGIFTLAAVLAAFGFVYWTAGIGEGGNTALLRVRIPGSASGLGRGSAVLFNGVKVGDVTRVYIDVTNPSVAIADTQVDRLTPITRSTKADIGIAGLTGQSNIELKGGDVNQPNLLAQADEAGEVAVITADPSAVTNLLQTAQDIFRRADTVLESLEGFVTEVREPLTQSVQNAQRFSEALGRNADGIDTFLANVSQLSETLGNASGQLDVTLEAAGQLLRSVEPERVAAIVANLEEFTQTLGETSDEITSIMAGVETAVESIGSFTGNAAQTLAGVDAIVGAVDPDTVRTAVTDIQAASRDARAVTADVAEFTSTIGDRAEDIDRIISEAAQLTQRLNQASARAETIMASIGAAAGNIASISERAGGTLGKVDEILEGVDPASVRTSLTNIAEASETARTVVADIAEVSETFGERSEDIDRIISEAGQLTQRLNQASARAETLMASIDTAAGNIASFSERAGGTLGRVDEILQGVDPASVRTSLTNIAQASETARTVVADIAKVSETFGARSEDVDQIITDTQQLASRLNEASVRVDGVLAKLDGFLGSGDGGDVIAEATETIRAFREVADTLNARIGTIAAGLERFSGKGLRDVEALVTESRRSINRIEQAITDLERNPQRIITGGDGAVPRYDGRARR